MSGDGLVLVPIGTGAAYARPGEAQSGYLVRGAGRAVMLDLGAGALNRLVGELPPEELDAVVITHLHPDHCVDLLALRVYMLFGPGRGTRLRLLGPPGMIARLAALAGDEGWDEAFAVEELTAGAYDLGGGLTLRAVEVPHLPPTFALRLETAGASVVYGADCAENPALAELARGCDLLLLECSFGAEAPTREMPHLGAREAARMAEAAGARRLLLTHCYPEHDRDRALALARAGTGAPVDWARQSEAVST